MTQVNLSLNFMSWVNLSYWKYRFSNHLFVGWTHYLLVFTVKRPNFQLVFKIVLKINISQKEMATMAMKIFVEVKGISIIIS